MAEPAEQFKERRRKGIGGSDAAAALGLSRWRSPLELYAIKTGAMEEPDLSDNEAVHFGKVLEDVVADEYERRTGRKVEYADPVTHPEHSWLIGTPDRRVYDDEEGTPGILEIKTAGAFGAGDWTSEPPMEAQVQLQHYLCASDATWGSFAVLLGGQRFLWLDVERNQRFIDIMVKREAEFWDRVVNHDPPPLSQIEADARALAALYPNDDNDAAVALPPDAVEWDRMRIEAAEEIKRLTAVKKDAENHLKDALGNHAVGYLRDGTEYSWKSQTRKSYTVAEASYRVLRRHKSKLK